MHLSGMTLQEQKQILSQRQIESVNILAMDAQALHELVAKEQEENPLVVPVSYEPFRAAGEGNFWDDPFAGVAAPAADTAADVLLPQIDMRAFSDTEEAAFRFIAESLNRSGLLTASLEELSNASGISRGVLQKCIGVMKKLEPAGVCASSLAECLELQLRSRGIEDALLSEMIRNHLNDVAAGSVGRIVRKTGSDARGVKERIAAIRSLNPCPLNGLTGEKAHWVIPDLLLSREGDSWLVELNDGGFRSFEIDDRYARLASETEDPELRGYFKQKLQRIKFLNDAMERRRNTLVDIGRIAAQKQSDSLLYGGALAPLSLHSVADLLELNPSTVSRAVNGKYIQYPGGFRELRALFARDAERAGRRERGGNVSRESVQQMIREILETEEKGESLSDGKIVRRLSACGVQLSRRTVAKYRSEIGIAGMHDRC